MADRALTKLLMIPIRCDALRLAAPEPVAAPMADWTELPYTDPAAPGGSLDVNPDSTWTSVSVLAEPFDRQVLSAGVHLSWALPDALTMGRHAGGAGGADDVVHPAVPDRWLVVRSGGPLPGRAWVVESDRLWPEGTPWERGRVSYPLTDAERGPHRQPWRYLGRTFEAATWQEDAGAEHLRAPLTALGWGEPLFAAFYPNCQGIFGLCDADVTAETAADGIAYTIFGWYSPKQVKVGEALAPQDPLAQLARESSLRKRDLLAAAKEELGLSWEDRARDPEGMLCFGRVTFSPDAREPAPPSATEEIAVAVGNTATEALSAYLAATIAPEDAVERRRVEDQLEAFVLLRRLDEHTLDLGPKFREARHGRGFRAIPGGTLFTLKPKKPAGDPGSHAAKAERRGTLHDLPPAIAHGLHALNAAQGRCDRGADEVRDLRRQIFASWHRYITCAHHLDEERSYPPIDDARRHVERLLAVLTLRLAHVGGAGAPDAAALAADRARLSALDLAPLLAPMGGDFAAWAAAVLDGKAPPSLARMRDDAHQALALTLAKLDPALQLEVELVGVPAPRYYQPTNPAVLLVGAGVAASDRHGEDGALHGLVTEQDPTRLSRAEPSILKALCDAAVAHVYASKGAEPDDRRRRRASGESLTKGNGWHPLAFDWEAGIEPLLGNVPSTHRRFPPSFVEDHYVLRERRSEVLSLVQATGMTIRSASYLTGRSILTPSAGTVLQQRIDAFLVSQVEAYLRDAKIDPEGRVTLAFLDDHRAAIEAWALDAYEAELAGIFLHAPVLPGADLLSAEQARQELLAKPPASSSAFFQQHTREIFDWIEERRAERGDPELEAADRRHHDAWPEDHVPLRVALRARDALAGLSLQAQPLGGFNEALLMHRQVLQLLPDDPHSFSPYRELSRDAVATAVGAEGHSAPLPHFDFHPIRSGDMHLRCLRLIDAFGRTRDVPAASAVTAEPLAGRSAHVVSLPARITQPARVLFRFLSAEDDAVESNAHPISSPVCGFLVPNHLDRSLLIYDGEGALMGVVDRRGRFRASPGRSGPFFPEDIPNRHLRTLTTWLCGRAEAMARKLDGEGAETRFIDDFLNVLESASESIDPEGAEQHAAQALLMGRPLALVRASVRLELQGLPAFNQSWEAFGVELARGTLDTDGFPDVRFPVRIGEHAQLNDGVVGYFRDAPGGDGYRGEAFYAPQSAYGPHLDEEDNLAVFHDPGRPLCFWQAPSSPPELVSLLVDPRCAVHCTTGVLPTKALRIPPEHYTRALARMRVTFSSSPIVSPAGAIELRLPQVPGFEWSWVERDGARFREVTTVPRVRREAVVKAFPDGAALWDKLLAKGWLKAEGGGGEQAARVYADELPDLGDPRAIDIARVLDLSTEGVARARAEAHFAGPAEIREGFLQLQESERGKR
jgi:hypothetical protein